MFDTPFLVERIDPSIPTDDLRTILRSICPVSDVTRTTYTFNGREIRLDSAIVNFQPKEHVDFSQIDPITVSGNVLSFKRITFPGAVLLGDCSTLSDSIIESHFSGYLFSLSRVRSATESFRLLKFQTEEGRDAAVEANDCCVIAGSVFSLRKYPPIRPMRYRRVSAFAGFISEVKARSEGLFTLVHLGVPYKINLHLGTVISGLLRKLVEVNPSIERLELPPIPGNFAVFRDLFWNLPTSVYSDAPQDVRFLFLMGAHLEIPPVMQMTESRYYENLTYEAVLAALEWTPPGSAGIVPHIRYLAFHIGKLIHEPSFQKLDLEIQRAVTAARNSSLLMPSPRVDEEVYRPVFAKMTQKDYVGLVSNEKIDLNIYRRDLVELVKACRTEPNRASAARSNVSDDAQNG
jgi:hypothetical protein